MAALLALTGRSENGITVHCIFVSRADVLVIVNAVHCIIFGAIGMAAEAKIQFITSGITFMNSRLGKGTGCSASDTAVCKSSKVSIANRAGASMRNRLIYNDCQYFVLLSVSFTVAGFFYVFVGSLSLEQDWWRLLIGACCLNIPYEY